MSAYYNREDDRYFNGDDRYLKGDDRYHRDKEDDRYFKGDERYLDDPRQRVAFHNGPPERVMIERIQRSHNRERIVLLLALAFFLATATTFAGVSTTLEPWWTQNGGSPEYERIQIGLWKACKRPTEDGTWACNDYASGTNDTPYGDMDVIKYCMITATAISGLAFILALVTIVKRNSSVFKSFVYMVGFLALVAAVLFGLCIGYASEQKLEAILVPTAIKDNINVELKLAMMFYFACVSAACAFVALIIPVVFVFISNDDTEEYANDNRNFGKRYSNSNRWDDRYNQSIFEREISRRGRNIIQQPTEYGRFEPPYKMNGYREAERRYSDPNSYAYDNDNHGYTDYRPNYKRESGIRRDQPSYVDHRQSVHRDRSIHHPDYPAEGYEQAMRQTYATQDYPEPAVISYNRPQITSVPPPPSYERHQSRNSNYMANQRLPQFLPEYTSPPARKYDPPVPQPRMVVIPQKRNTLAPRTPEPKPRPTRQGRKLDKTAGYVMKKIADHNRSDYEEYFDSEY